MYFHSIREEGYRFYYRCWLHLTQRQSIDLDLNLFDKNTTFGLSVGRGNSSIKFHIAIPLLISFWIKFGGVLWFGEKRELGISAHNGSIWFNLWVDPMDGRYRVWHVSQWIFGKSVYSEEIIETRDIVIPMPEKFYPAKATLLKSTWSFPRWFNESIKRVKIDVPEGIPHEGKGENSYDCGKDATFGMTCNASSIPEGVGKLVGSVLNDRVRYGGWDDYNWNK